MIKFILITNDPKLATHAENCGVGRIFVDLEVLGKQERQGHLDTFISNHKAADVAKVKNALKSAELLVRLNPIHEGTEEEVENAIAAGADLLMLPMFRTSEEVSRFSSIVAGRARVVPLVETLDGANCLDEVVKVPGVSEIYIGLNDLHLDIGLSFMFELLSNGMVDELSSVIKNAGLPFGFGGIARVGEGIIPGELILAEHLRLGSSTVILSRTFHRGHEASTEQQSELKEEVGKLLKAGEVLSFRGESEIAADRIKMASIVNDFVASKIK